MTNLRNIFVQSEYNALAGPDWPSYEDFLQGDRSQIPEIQEEINGWVKTFQKTGQKFPIRTATSCQSKWTWSTIYLNYLSTASCHRVVPVPFALENFDNFHNVPKKLQDRQLMLAGKWPTGGCEYCRVIEDAGGWSDRQHNLDIRGLTPPELEDDPTAISVTPRIVEIFAQNTCNLQCVYCNGGLSSKIEQENRRFGTFDHGGVQIPVVNIPETTRDYFLAFIRWLDQNLHHLRRLHLLGGETFIQHDLMEQVLDVIERRPNPELELCIFSNLNVPDRYWDLYTGRIRELHRAGNIKCFDLTASIDCWDDASEYVRFGLDLEKFEQRFAWAAEQDPAWLRLNVNQTVTCMTMRTMPELIDKVRFYSKNRHIGHYFQFYTGPHMFQHPNIFAYDFWAEDFERIYRAMPVDTVEQREAIPRMKGMESYLKTFTQHNWAEIKRLHVLMDEMDRRRNTDWRSIFPYLDIQKYA